MEVAQEPDLNAIKSLTDIPPEQFVDAKELLDTQRLISEGERNSRSTIIKFAAIGEATALAVGILAKDLRVTGFLSTFVFPISLTLSQVLIPYGPIDKLKDKIEAMQEKIPQLADEKTKNDNLEKAKRNLVTEEAPALTPRQFSELKEKGSVRT